MKRLFGLIPVLLLLTAGCAHSNSSMSGNDENGLSQTLTQRYADSLMSKRDPTIIAHRGLHHTLPENSLEAMVAGWEAGIEWCECDVYLSSDDVAVFMHDAKLDRTTEAKGELAKRSWAELRQMRLKNPDGTLSGCRIPSLEQVLAAMPADRGLLIELKPADNEKLVREVLRLAEGKRCVIQSFDDADVRHALRLGKLPVAFLAGKPEKLDLALTGAWPAINIDFKVIDAEFARRATEQGKSLGTWTVNEPADIERMLDIGVERIITDQPERVREILAKNAGGR